MSDPHLDVHTAAEMLLETLKTSRLSGEETPQTKLANQYLFERLMNYKVMMRSRQLTSAYEFLYPLDGKDPGWYYASAGPARNWIGPYNSRKAAVEAKTNKPGTTRAWKPLDMLDREIFGE